MKFDNIDDDPEPKDINILYSAWADQALRVPHYLDPELSIVQEPSIVELPDGRLFTTLRSASGYIWYSLSDDHGKTWCNPRPLLRKDHGKPILQPVACCPIYELDNGRYVLLHYNHRGDIHNEANVPFHLAFPRAPAYLALGEFRPEADQPVWFSHSKIFLDNGFLNPAGVKEIAGSQVATYTSMTNTNGKNILWYPDAKCWLLGKEITEEFLSDMLVP